MVWLYVSLGLPFAALAIALLYQSAYRHGLKTGYLEGFEDARKIGRQALDEVIQEVQNRIGMRKQEKRGA